MIIFYLYINIIKLKFLIMINNIKKFNEFLNEAEEIISDNLNYKLNEAEDEESDYSTHKQIKRAIKNEVDVKSLSVVTTNGDEYDPMYLKIKTVDGQKHYIKIN
jgi:hypothetical protein